MTASGLAATTYRCSAATEAPLRPRFTAGPVQTTVGCPGNGHRAPAWKAVPPRPRRSPESSPRRVHLFSCACASFFRPRPPRAGQETWAIVFWFRVQAVVSISRSVPIQWSHPHEGAGAGGDDVRSVDPAPTIHPGFEPKARRYRLESIRPPCMATALHKTRLRRASSGGWALGFVLTIRPLEAPLWVPGVRTRFFHQLAI